MKAVGFPIWDDAEDEIVNEINQVTQQIQSVHKKLKTHDEISEKDQNTFNNNLYETLNYWTGRTYVGIKKPKSIENAFQNFFENLIDSHKN